MYVPVCVCVRVFVVCIQTQETKVPKFGAVLSSASKIANPEYQVIITRVCDFKICYRAVVITFAFV